MKVAFSWRSGPDGFISEVGVHADPVSDQLMSDCLSRREDEGRAISSEQRINHLKKGDGNLFFFFLFVRRTK